MESCWSMPKRTNWTFNWSLNNWSPIFQLSLDWSLKLTPEYELWMLSVSFVIGILVGTFGPIWFQRSEAAFDNYDFKKKEPASSNARSLGDHPLLALALHPEIVYAWCRHLFGKFLLNLQETDLHRGTTSLLIWRRLMWWGCGTDAQKNIARIANAVQCHS